MNNLFASILKKGLQSITLRSGNKDTYVGVDIGSSSLKVVQLKKSSGKILLETYGEIALGPFQEKSIGELVQFEAESVVPAIEEVVSEANITGTNAGIAIQSSASLVFILGLPTGDRKDLSSIVLTEARKYIPVPLSEVTLDWWPIPQPEFLETGEIPQTEVLVAALRNEKLQMYKNIAAQSKFNKSFFEIEIFSAIRSSFGNELSSVVLVDMGASSTRVAVIQYGVVKRFNTIRKGSYQMTETIARSLDIQFSKAEMLKKEVGLNGNEANGHEAVKNACQAQLRGIFSELKAVILRYEKDYHKAVSKMILIGGGSRLPGLVDYIKEQFDGEIEFGNPFSRVENPQFLDQVLEVSGPEFAIAVGLALKNLE